MLDMKLLFVRLLIPILFIIILSWNGIITVAATTTEATRSTFDIFTIDSSPYVIHIQNG